MTWLNKWIMLVLCAFIGLVVYALVDRTSVHTKDYGPLLIEATHPINECTSKKHVEPYWCVLCRVNDSDIVVVDAGSQNLAVVRLEDFVNYRIARQRWETRQEFEDLGWFENYGIEYLKAIWKSTQTSLMLAAGALFMILMGYRLDKRKPKVSLEGMKF